MGCPVASKSLTTSRRRLQCGLHVIFVQHPVQHPGDKGASALTGRWFQAQPHRSLHGNTQGGKGHTPTRPPRATLQCMHQTPGAHELLPQTRVRTQYMLDKPELSLIPCHMQASTVAACNFACCQPQPTAAGLHPWHRQHCCWALAGTLLCNNWPETCMLACALLNMPLLGCPLLRPPQGSSRCTHQPTHSLTVKLCLPHPTTPPGRCTTPATPHHHDTETHCRIRGV